MTMFSSHLFITSEMLCSPPSPSLFSPLNNWTHIIFKHKSDHNIPTSKPINGFQLKIKSKHKVLIIPY